MTSDTFCNWLLLAVCLLRGVTKKATEPIFGTECSLKVCGIARHRSLLHHNHSHNKHRHKDASAVHIIAQYLPHMWIWAFIARLASRALAVESGMFLPTHTSINIILQTIEQIFIIPAVARRNSRPPVAVTSRNVFLHLQRQFSALHRSSRYCASLAARDRGEQEAHGEGAQGAWAARRSRRRRGCSPV